MINITEPKQECEVPDTSNSNETPISITIDQIIINCIRIYNLQNDTRREIRKTSVIRKAAYE